MYLLILVKGITISLSSLFTSHYVSINSRSAYIQPARLRLFTSHYVSINSSQNENVKPQIVTFTSHYVSINSIIYIKPMDTLLYLHPTMYLLILCVRPLERQDYKHLHPTMYLLIPYPRFPKYNTAYHLHPTMYLLIHTLLNSLF